jgi:hypothetical protein
MKTPLMLLGASMALILAGCNPGTVEPAPTLSPHFGEAVNQNMAAQIINPAPTYAGASQGDGRRAADAYKRYEEGRVHRPAPPLTGVDYFRPPSPMQMQAPPAPVTTTR